MKFNNYKDLTAHLVNTVVEAIPDSPAIEIKEGYSNVSCSAYLDVSFWVLDEDDDPVDYIDGCKVRFSDHADKNGSDLTIRFDDALNIDELGSVEVAGWRIDEMVAEAVTFIRSYGDE